MLAHSVLNSLLVSYFSLFKVPVGVIKNMEKLVRNFFWDSRDLKARSHLVNWGKTSLPLKYRGLGLGAFKNENSALLFK